MKEIRTFLGKTPNAQPRLRLPAACGRRRRALVPLAHDILFARGAGAPLAPAGWGALAALGWLFSQAPELGPVLLPSVALFGGLVLIALFDARYFVVPDAPLLVLAVCGAATTLASAPEEAAGRLAAAVGGFAALKAVAIAFEWLRGAPGLGDGDARLFAVAGLWLGATGLPSALLYAVFSALVSAAIALRQGTLEDARQPMPFAPHLALGIWLAWAIGPLEFG